MTTVLFVCEGNVCRSPFAELLLRERLRESGATSAHVTSAGTRARAGAAMHPSSARLLAALGVEDRGAGARPLTSAVLDGVDLVLTMERAQRGDVLDLAPRLLRRTFTVLEFARLVRPLLDGDRVHEDFWDELPRLVAEQRLTTRPSSGDDDDVPDPVRGTEQAFHATAETLLPALEVLREVVVRTSGAQGCEASATLEEVPA